MAAAAAKYYFRFCICWCRCLQKVQIYQQTKFCRYISIHIWDITTFGLEKPTSAILEFYITAIGILFCIMLPNFIQTASAAEIWRQIYFSRWRLRPLNTISGFVFVDVSAFRRSNLSANQISSTFCQFVAEI